MKIGILKADRVRPDLSKRFGEYPDMFNHLFQSTGEAIEMVTFDVMNFQYPGNIHEVDAYLITGSASSVYDKDEWILRLIQFVQFLDQEKKKMLGICFGHQLIAHALGGLTEKSPTGWHIGNRSHSLNEEGTDLLIRNEPFKLIFSHQDEVIIPAKDSITLASTKKCPIAICSIGKHIFTVQGHPEFNAEYAKGLIDARRSIFEQGEYEEGIKTLEEPNDSTLVAKWLLDFIK